MSAMKTGTWTRRQFGQMAAAIAAGWSLPRWAHGAASVPQADGFAFAGVVPESGDGAIHVLRVADGRLMPLSVTPSVAPGRLLMHPSLPVLYALHDVALWDYLPRGAVSAYRFDSANGSLSLMDTQSLSLAATHPRDAVVFSQGTALFVTTDAGIYNVLPLAEDGELKPVSAIRKVIGAGDAAVQLHWDGETLLVTERGNTQANGFRVVQDEFAEIRQVEMGAAAPSTAATQEDGRCTMVSRMATFSCSACEAWYFRGRKEQV